MKKSRPPQDPDSFTTAYFHALRWLTTRDLSEGQVRARLSLRGYTRHAIDPAIQRLIAERTLDDRRAAAAVARTEAKVRRHGPRRILARLRAMRIDDDLAKEVVREVFGDTDQDEMLNRTLDKRIRGNTARLREPQERRRLLAYLVRQGFEASAASAAIRKRLREK